MTAVGLQVSRRAPAPTRDELRRQLLALVLAFVLVWYTFVVPANAAARSYVVHDDEGGDGEVRGVGGDVKVRTEPVEDLDWPEYIYP
jgi:hypothetical protein